VWTRRKGIPLILAPSQHPSLVDRSTAGHFSGPLIKLGAPRDIGRFVPLMELALRLRKPVTLLLKTASFRAAALLSVQLVIERLVEGPTRLDDLKA
jgi:hypothetical protein